MRFKTEWTSADFTMMNAAILNHFKRQTVKVSTGQSSETKRLRSFKAIDECFGLAYTSSGMFACYGVCNAEVNYFYSSELHPQKYEFFVISEDGQPFAILWDKNEWETYVNLSDNGRRFQTIQILAKEWFDKVNVNSYFSAMVFVDNDHVLSLPFQYGYGSHYIDQATAELAKAGFLPGLEYYPNGAKEALWRYCDKRGLKLLTSKSENCKRRDLLTREDVKEQFQTA